MKKIMPDLFVVMNKNELKTSIEYANSQGAKRAKRLVAMNYDLFINGENMESYYKESGKWFPDFGEYINLSTSNDDEIGILLSSTVWNEYDERILYKVLRENYISCDLEYNPLFIRPRQLISSIECEKIILEGKTINSPWTARDIEVIEAALQTISNINNATILHKANFEIKIYVKDFTDTVDEFLIAEEVSNKKVIEHFKYPNILHLETNNGNFNIYMGENIDLKAALVLLKGKNIDTILKDYEDEDKSLLLYESHEKALKL